MATQRLSKIDHRKPVDALEHYTGRNSKVGSAGVGGNAADGATASAGRRKPRAQTVNVLVSILLQLQPARRGANYCAFQTGHAVTVVARAKGVKYSTVMQPNRLKGEELNSWRLAVRAAVESGRWTMRSLAAAAGVPESTLRYWMSERSAGPHLAARQGIASVIGAVS